jgi:hypothetical protein
MSISHTEHHHYNGHDNPAKQCHTALEDQHFSTLQLQSQSLKHQELHSQWSALFLHPLDLLSSAFVAWWNIKQFKGKEFIAESHISHISQKYEGKIREHWSVLTTCTNIELTSRKWNTVYNKSAFSLLLHHNLLPLASQSFLQLQSSTKMQLQESGRNSLLYWNHRYYWHSLLFLVVPFFLSSLEFALSSRVEVRQAMTLAI